MSLAHFTENGAKMQAAIAKLNRVLSDLTELANHFEDAGFEGQSETLDDASEKVEKVRDGLVALAEFKPQSSRRSQRKGA